MADIGEKAISNLAGNLNSGLSYLITAVHMHGLLYLDGRNSQKYLHQDQAYF